MESAVLHKLAETYSHDLVKYCCKVELSDLRSALRSGEGDLPAEGKIIRNIRSRVEAFLKPRVDRVINCTGILLHTGLGRAPMIDEAYERAFRRVRGVCNVELNLETGTRGDRQDNLEDLLTFITGAESAAVVNNNAAAVLLALNTLANRGQTLVSRGQLIEIGGSFRLPEVMRKSGTRLVEVGTTNRTYLKDYLDAIGPGTKAVLVAHTSNYRVKGFVHEPAMDEIAPACVKRGLAVIHDLGGGVLVDLRNWKLPHEPVVRDSLKAGAQVVTFSGDKVLGGPQCGILVGANDFLKRIKKNPLMRALRPDKLTLAFLEETLKLYLSPGNILYRHPVLARLTESKSDALQRAKQLFDKTISGKVPDDVKIEVIQSQSQLGSGALPLEEFPSAAIRISIKGENAASLAARLRKADPPLIGFVHRGWVHLDLKAVLEEDFKLFIHTLRQVLRIK